MRTLYKIFCLIYFTVCALLSFAQSKETPEQYLARIKNSIDSIKNAKKNGSAKSQSTNSNIGRYSQSKYSTNKTTIDNAYNFLTPTDKDKIKNYPAAPVAFRTADDAIAFVKTIKNIDVNADLQKYAKEKSMPLTGYLISYLKLKMNAEAIVKEAAQLKIIFEKSNPTVQFGNKVGTTYVGENSLVYLPLGDASFVDKVVEAKYGAGNIQFAKENCIGTPDYVLMQKLENNKGIYSLGAKGTIVVQFTNNALIDVNGADLFVFEAGEIEPTKVDISKDGISWISIGTITGGTASLDINKYVKPNEYFYYVRLTDLNTESTIAGADIDAIATIGAAMRLYLNAEVLFDMGKSELKKDGIAAIQKLALALQSMDKAHCDIEGHTDDVGNDAANNTLSLQRANAVAAVLKDALKNKSNFTYTQLGKGKTNPIVPNTSDDNRRQNRRVEILVTPK